MSNDTEGAQTAEEAQKCPPVRVNAMTIGLRDDEEPREWYACCTEVVWLQEKQAFSRGCNWYGAYRDSEREARADAARHRRSHRKDGVR